MKTVLDSNNVSIHLWQDEAHVSLAAEGLYYEGNLDDESLNETNAQIITDITAPEDWYGRKYCYVDGQWELNPNDPTL